MALAIAVVRESSSSCEAQPPLARVFSSLALPEGNLLMANVHLFLSLSGTTRNGSFRSLFHVPSNFLIGVSSADVELTNCSFSCGDYVTACDI